MINICKEACNVYDQYGNFGDVSFDVVVDENLNVWILEINSNHAKTIRYILEIIERCTGKYIQNRLNTQNFWRFLTKAYLMLLSHLNGQ